MAENTRGPAYIVYELVGFALPSEFGVGGTAREGRESATRIGIRGNLAEGSFVPVAVKQVEHGRCTGVLRVFDGNAPGVQAAAKTVQNLDFGAVVTL